MEYTQEQREKLAAKEYKRIAGLFKGVDNSRQKLVEQLLNDAAFMTVALSELRLTIARDGIIETYRNSETQYGNKASIAVQTYDKLVNTYSKLITQLQKELPEEEAGSELLEFLRTGK